MSRLSRNYTAYFCYAAFAFAMLALYALHFDFYNPVQSPKQALARIFFFDRFFAEVLTVGALLLILIEGKTLSRIVFYFIFAAYFFVNIVQWLSLKRGYEFLSRVAVENMGHISLLMNTDMVSLLLLFVLVFGGIIWSIERSPQRPSRYRKSKFVFLLAMASVLYMSRLWLPDAIMEAREPYFIRNHLVHSSPVAAFIKILGKSREEVVTDLTPNEKLEARKFGFEINLDENYPFITPTFYTKSLGFVKKTGVTTTPNVIVFFVEGMSARTLDVYNPRFKSLTPHITDFARESTVITNYFNHTAATYRGLHGQLCSIYPTFGGTDGWDKDLSAMPAVDHYCLNRFMNGAGYKTIFFDAHRKDSARIDEMMQMLGFDEIWTAERLSQRFLADVEPLRPDALSDPQFLQSFTSWLEMNEDASTVSGPFFAGLYNLGTHAWQDIQKDGASYEDGSSHVLNTIHTYDAAFGRFWNYFKQSPYAHNTIVILTADHSHYPEEPYVALFKDDPKYRPIFVDRIPLIVYDPTRELPKIYDANYATSIDFAPTLLHLLDFPNQRNPFLGFSLFEPDHKVYKGLGIASIGGDLFIVDRDGIHNREFPDGRDETLRVAERIVQKTKEIELSNRLWQLDSRL